MNILGRLANERFSFAARLPMTRRPASTRAESAPAGPANPLGAVTDGGRGAHNLRSWLMALGGLAGLTLAMFGSVLFSSGGNVLSCCNTETKAGSPHPLTNAC